VADLFIIGAAVVAVYAANWILRRLEPVSRRAKLALGLACGAIAVACLAIGPIDRSDAHESLTLVFVHLKLIAFGVSLLLSVRLIVRSVWKGSSSRSSGMRVSR
jgi:hypothetical protein